VIILDFSTEFWLQIGFQAIFLAFFAGIVWTKLSYIEEKQDKHNKLIERMYHVENSADKAHDRLDALEKLAEDERG
jgi:hypothetical protein